MEAKKFYEERVANKILFNRHIKRKNNDLVAAMYAMYKTGKSLEYIAGIYKQSRQSIYDVFSTRGYKLRSKELKGLTIIDGHRFTLMKGGYLRGTVNKKRVTIQKYVWEKIKGLVAQGFVIHHIDGNKLNNDITNLELVGFKDMSKKFNPKGNNQYKK